MKLSSQIVTIVTNTKKISFFMIFCKFLPHKGNFSWKVPLNVIYTFHLKHNKYPFCAPIFHPSSETKSYWNLYLLNELQKNILLTKMSRARVIIEGQCVLLQIPLQIKMFNFLLNSQNHRMNCIFLGILLNSWKTL